MIGARMRRQTIFSALVPPSVWASVTSVVDIMFSLYQALHFGCLQCCDVFMAQVLYVDNFLSALQIVVAEEQAPADFASGKPEGQALDIYCSRVSRV